MALWLVEYANPRAINGPKRHKDLFYKTTEAEVRTVLIDRGMLPIKIRPYKQRQKLFVGANGQRAVTLLETLAFSTIDCPPAQALAQVIEEETDPDLHATLIPARRVLDGGGSMTDALRALNWFPSDTLAIIEAGERSRDLRGAAEYAAERLRVAAKRMRQATFLLSLLAFQLLMIVMAKVWVSMNFKSFIIGLGVKAPNEAAQAEFDGMIDMVLFANNMMLLGAMAVLVFGIVLAPIIMQNRHNPHHWANRLFYKLPGLHAYLSDLDMSSGMRVVNRLLGHKQSLGESLRIAHHASVVAGNKHYWSEAEKRLLTYRPGEAMSQKPMEREEMSKLRSAATIAHLENIAKQIAERRDERADRRYGILVRNIWSAYIIYEVVAVGILVYGLNVIMKGAELSQETMRSMNF